eukprot:1151939-Pelagomonas_calceolata.AAC.2
MAGAGGCKEHYIWMKCTNSNLIRNYVFGTLSLRLIDCTYGSHRRREVRVHDSVGATCAWVWAAGDVEAKFAAYEFKLPG